MANRHARIEIRKAASYIGLSLQQLQAMRKRAATPIMGKTRQLSPSTSTATSSRIITSIAEEEFDIEKPTIERVVRKPPNPDQKRVFLYMQLQGLINIPETKTNKLKLRLSHQRNKVTLMSEHRMHQTDEVSLLSLDETKPTFTLTIDQDNVDHMNGISDNPLRLMIYDVVPVLYENEDGDLEIREEEVLLSEGVIDLLPFFTKQRKVSKVEAFLYPSELTKANAGEGTTKSLWQVYSLIPLLKNVSVNNVVFITFESIYNAMPELLDLTDQLVAQLYFQSRIPNKRKMHEKLKLCAFSNFLDELIMEQDHNTRWETLLPDTNASTGVGSFIEPSSNMSIRSGTAIVPTQKLLTNLLCSEGLYPSLGDVNLEEDDALICNAMRRYILTEELGKVLEDVVAFNEQEILVEIHTKDNPSNVLLKGVIDLSIFLYPKVNSCRFGVRLYPTRRLLKQRKQTSKSTRGTNPSQDISSRLGTHSRAHSTESAGMSARSSARRMNRTLGSTGISLLSSTSRLLKRKKYVTFAIINICLNTPITENQGERTLGSINLGRCTAHSDEKFSEKMKTNEDRYREFDDAVREIIEHILTNKIKMIEEDQEYFCGQVRNLTNRILKLIQFDFNVRVRTKNNIQFTNLMTLVYRELEERITNIIVSCGDKEMIRCRSMTPETRDRIVTLISQAKYMWEVDNFELYDILIEKVHKLGDQHSILYFFLMLLELERQNFEPVKEYLAKPLYARYKPGENISTFICIYVNYMEKCKSEEGATTAIEYLTTTLTYFAIKHATIIEAWILLYCVYKICSYTPGMSYARWKYENLFDINGTTSDENWITVPKDRFAIYHLPNHNFETVTTKNYFQAIQFFLRYGMYKFAEYLYKEVALESRDEIQKFCMSSTLAMLQKGESRRPSARSQNGSDGGDNNTEETFVAQAHVNGHLEYYRDKINAATAMMYYERVLKMEPVFEHDDYELGLLRYGYYMKRRRLYESAAKAFEKIYSTDNTLAALIGLGECKYMMGNLVEAERHFSESTKYKIHIPDVWGYLALINIRQKNVWKALECWKYAKLHPEVVICDEVIEELDKVDYLKCSLYVDAPTCTPDDVYLESRFSWSELTEKLGKKGAGDAVSLVSARLSSKSLRKQRSSKMARSSRVSKMQKKYAYKYSE